jgi:DNA-directed RNA polymerase subunit RPC12/RpoP
MTRAGKAGRFTMKKAYRCEDCGKEVMQDGKKKTPDCCGETMKEISLAACRDAGPESSGSGAEPCEDFTGKQS